MGYSREMLDKPIVGICHSASGYNNCHRDMPALIDAVKRGVLAAGALPIDFPTISLGETFLNPTSLKYRNLMSMDVEEMIRAQPMDAVVLIGGCDKTVPAQLMGAASADIPTVQVVTGPMSTSRYRAERLGACTDCRRFWATYRAGKITDAEIEQVEGPPRVHHRHLRCYGHGQHDGLHCRGSGHDARRRRRGSGRRRGSPAHRRSQRQARRFAHGSDMRPSKIITEKSVENALRVLLAIGGSTNAIIHLTAIAGRLGIKIDLKRLNELSDTTPVLVDLKPSGVGYMEDLAASGGIPAVMRELKALLHLDCLTITGETIGERIEAWDPWVDRNVVRSFAEPLQAVGGLVALFGNIAPGGAILKRAAADSALFEKEARCVVFESLEDLSARIDTPELDVTADDILVLKNAGPKSEACMPEAGYLPIPKKLASAGVKDMMRLSDARMSGTAFGSVILHVSPDSASGGPLALVENGDRIRVSVSNRSVDLLVDEKTLAARRAKLPPAPPQATRGHSWLHDQFMTQAEEGCDFSFLKKEGVTSSP